MVTTPTLWTGPIRVNTSDNLKHQGDGDVIALPDGGFYVVWTDESLVYNNPGNAIVGQRFDVLGNKLGGEQFISGLTSGSHLSPSASAFEDGTFAVAFIDGGSNSIVARRVDPGIGAVNTYPIGVGYDPSVAAFANGSFVTSYTVDRGTHTDVVGRIVSATGVIGSEFDIFNDTHNSSLTEVVRLTNGNFVAVGAKEGATPSDLTTVFRIFSPAGAALSAVQPADFSQYLKSGEAPAVTALVGGGFAAAWAYDFNHELGVMAAVYTATGALVAGQIFVTSLDALQTEADVTALQDGGFVVSWDSDALNLVRARRFDPSGNRVGDEFTIASNTAVDTARGALLHDGRFVSVTGDAALYDDNDVLRSIWDPRGKLILGTADVDVLTSRLDGATVRGLGGDDTLHGFAGKDRLDGGKGGDLMKGRGGNDTYIVDSRRDVISESGGSGTDRVLSSVNFSLADRAHAKGNVENLTLTGSASKATGSDRANILTGNSRDNTLLGGGGDDKLFGGRGSDKITGGRGADHMHAGGGDERDRFIFTSDADSGVNRSEWDRVFDFDWKGNESVSDKIDLSALNVKWANINIDTGGSHVTVSIDTHGSSAPDMVIQVMSISQLSRADFIL